MVDTHVKRRVSLAAENVPAEQPVLLQALAPSQSVQLSFPMEPPCTVSVDVQQLIRYRQVHALLLAMQSVANEVEDLCVNSPEGIWPNPEVLGEAQALQDVLKRAVRANNELLRQMVQATQWQDHPAEYPGQVRVLSSVEE